MLKNLIPYFTIAICLCLALFTVVFAETEPNNTPGTATPLAPNSSSGGSLTETTDDVDWWKITTTFDGSLVVNTTSDPTLDVDLHLYDQDGTTQIASYDTSVGIHEATHRYDLATGTYYVKASRYSGSGSYSISNVYVPTGLANDSEPNDSSSIAQILAPNNSTTGHLGYYGEKYTDVYDWWKVTTTFDGSLVVNTVSDSSLDIDLFMYDQDGKTQIASYDTSVGIREATHFYNLTPGTYYIKALKYSGYGSYTISNIYTPTGLANDAEPNDSVQVAITLAVNDSTTGHLGYLIKKDVYDTYDWWKVSLPVDGNLTVRTYSDATLDIDLFTYDINGTNQIAGYDISTGRSEATHYNGLKAGTYFIKALRYGGYGSYTITSVYVSTKLANDTEPNDSLAAARSITLNSLSTGHLGFFSNGVTDQYDFYTFTLPVAWDTLFVRTDSDPTIDIDLVLYNQLDNQINSAGTTGTMELLTQLSAATGTYSIRLKAYSGYGSYGVIVSNIRPNTPLVSVQEQEPASGLPKNFSLSQNYPNPFNPTTSISYTIPQGGIQHAVSVRIFDLLGREVATLVNEIKPAGTYTVMWNAASMPSGIYFYRLQAGTFTETKRLVLLK